MLPFHMTCKNPCSSLVKLSDGRYQFVSGDTTSPLMVGFQYVLVDEPFRDLLGSYGIRQIQFEPTVIWHRARDQEIFTHTRVKVEQFFTFDDIRDLSLDGKRLLVLDDHYLFASPSLKAHLESEKLDFLRFTEGFSEFAGQGV